MALASLGARWGCLLPLRKSREFWERSFSIERKLVGDCTKTNRKGHTHTHRSGGSATTASGSQQRAQIRCGTSHTQRRKVAGLDRLKLLLEGSLGQQLHPHPRGLLGRPGQPADTKVKEVTSSMSIVLPGLPSSSPSQLSRPGHPAPFRAFGPGSRSCDVISKASALSSDTQPCLAGPSAQALFTEPGRGMGRRNEPALLQAGRSRSRPHPYCVSTCCWVGAATYGTGREPAPPHPPDPSTLCQPVWPHTSLQYCCILQFPRAEQNRGWEIRSCASRPSRIRRGKVRLGEPGPGPDRTGKRFPKLQAQGRRRAGSSRRRHPAAPKGATLPTPAGRPPRSTPPPPRGKIGGDQ